jgi:hypothetical protein
MIAGCGTLLPTRSIQPRNPPPSVASDAPTLTGCLLAGC